MPDGLLRHSERAFVVRQDISALVVEGIAF